MNKSSKTNQKELRVIFNQFNFEDGKYQIPATIVCKGKLNSGNNTDYYLVEFPNGKTCLMTLESVEAFSIRKIDARKIPTVKYAQYGKL